jgi:hypothetical protein
MQSKQAIKWMVLVPLALLLAVTGIGTADEPLAIQPSAISCGDSATCSTAGSSVKVRNSGAGTAFEGQHTWAGIGVEGKSNRGVGVKGSSNRAAGVKGWSWAGNGVAGISELGYGVNAYSANSYAVHAVTGSGSYGVYGQSSTNSLGAGVIGFYNGGVGDGVQGISNGRAGVYGSGGSKGVYGTTSAGGGEGVRGDGTGEYTEGVLGTATGIHGTGVYGIASATSGDPVGVWGQTGVTWGLYTDQSLYVGNGCIGCLIAFIGRNADTGALEMGDVVAISGVAPSLLGQPMPLLEVQRATASDGALGIVQARAEVTTRDKLVLKDGTEQTEAIEMANMAQGPVAPGDYLFIVIQGLIQVRADPGSGIQAGDRLATGGDGVAILAAPDAQTIGRAVDAVDSATGLVWVLVDLQ